MTLQVVYSVSAGVTSDISSRVFMASERLGLPPFSITQNAEEGSVAMSTLTVDDPSGNLTLKGHRRIYFVETAAPTNDQVIGNVYVGKKEISRGDWNVGPLARTYSVSVADQNTLIGRRIMVGADANRPAETDVARVQWLLTTTEANEFNGSTTYVNTVGAIQMDAVDYRDQSVEQILNDCAQASGKNYWIIYEQSLGEFSLWYDFDYSATYSSTLLLSNDEADVDDITTYAYFPTSTLSQDPGRVYSGTLLPYGEEGGWVYETYIATGNEFVFRDVSYPSFNVKTEAMARARARRYNFDSRTEEDVVKVSFVVPAGWVNGLRQGMRIQAKGTHWAFTGGNDYTAYTWMRALNRTVTQLSSTHYRIDAELSPIIVPEVVAPNAYMCGPYSAYTGSAAVAVLWAQAGGECNRPPISGVTMLGSVPSWAGWGFTIPITDLTFHAAVRSVPGACGGGTSRSFWAELNGVPITGAIATHSTNPSDDVWRFDATVPTISPGDEIRFKWSSQDGCLRQAGNNAGTDLTYITGGLLV